MRNLFTTKSCSTHTKCDWSLYCLVWVWYANFDWRSNRWLYYNGRVKFLDRYLNRSVALFHAVTQFQAFLTSFIYWSVRKCQIFRINFGGTCKILEKRCYAFLFSAIAPFLKALLRLPKRRYYAFPLRIISLSKRRYYDF